MVWKMDCFGSRHLMNKKAKKTEKIGRTVLKLALLFLFKFLYGKSSHFPLKIIYNYIVMIQIHLY